MISDEMKELLSAYVDDELRPADVGRVEELMKRDPELRTEVDAYRKLRTKLRDWDAAEHGGEPPATLAQRALARARTLQRDRKSAARGRLLSMVFSPVSIAAALLIAATLGLVLARGDAPPAPGEMGTVDVAEVKPFDSIPAHGSVVTDAPAVEPQKPLGLAKYFDERVRGRLVDGVVMSDTALRFKEEQDQLEKITVRRRERQKNVVEPKPRLTGVFDGHVMALVKGYEAALEPYDGLVMFRAPAVARPKLPFALTGAPAGLRGGVDLPSDTKRLRVTWTGERRLYAPLGEVWIGRRDAQRVRLVAAANVVHNDDVVAMAWGDNKVVKATRKNLEVEDYILGPEARRRLAGIEGHDPAFVAWLAQRYGGALPEVFTAAARKHKRAHAKFVAALAADEQATGFGVLDAKGRLIGLELFASHELMMALAPRLLRGYLVESDGAIRLSKPDSELASPVRRAAQELLDEMPAKHIRIDEGEWKGTTLEEHSEALRQVTMRSGGKIVGHGIVDKKSGRPVHLSVFGG